MASLPRTVKLMNCLACGDVVRLFRQPRYCRCRRCSGKYVAQYVVEVSGPARILGLRVADYLEAPLSAEASLSKVKEYGWYVVPIDSGEVLPGLEGDVE